MADDIFRYINNPFPDWTAYKIHLQESGTGNDTKYSRTIECNQTLQKSRLWLKDHIKEMHTSYPPQTDIAPATNPKKKKQRDCSIYTGAGGNAYMHWKLSRFYTLEGDADRSFDHLLKGLEAVNTALMISKEPNQTGCAFYVGVTGIHALAAVLYSQYKEPLKVEYHMEQLLSFLEESLQANTPDELLFGRAGYLSCLLLVRKHISKEICDKMALDKSMKLVFTELVKSGKQQSLQDRDTRAKKCLKYIFYGNDYLGAAHGIAGILYVLLQFPEWCKDPDTNIWITGTLTYLLSLQNSDGNFPTTVSGRRDRMVVHWCHGAPGFTALFHTAYKVYGNTKYLKAMEMALNCIWKYGVLRKGFGVCHGIAGNGYTFLCLYKETGQDEYYYKALQMAECVFSDEIKKTIEQYIDPQRYRVGVPDMPYSLMEGLAGTVCFFCDLLHPEQAAFPGYDGEF